MAAINFKRVKRGEDTAWSVIREGCVIGHVAKSVSLGRSYSKSQMGTRHVNAWRGTVADIDGLTEDERRAVDRELRRRDKRSREAAGDYMLASYLAANVPFPSAEDAQAA